MKDSILSYGKKNFRPLIITAMVFLIYFFPYLGNTHVGLDTHTFISYPGSTTNWLSIGRQGGALLHLILFASKYSMFYAQGMAVLTYFLALLFWCYLFKAVADVSTWMSCFYFLLFMIHPMNEIYILYVARSRK